MIEGRYSQVLEMTGYTIKSKGDGFSSSHPQTPSETPRTISRCNNGQLRQACSQGNLAVVKRVLSLGREDINCRDKMGRTPVMTAAYLGRATVFDFLLSQGCNLSVVSDTRDNVLHEACKGGNINIVRKLIYGEKMDIESRGIYGMTPVMFAVLCERIRVVELLMSKGCNMKALANGNENILHLACRGGGVGMVKYVLSTVKPDIDTRNNKGESAVMIATFKGYLSVVDLMVRAGCNLSILRNDNETILHMACRGGDTDMVRYILSKGVFGIESRGPSGWTPVMTAARYGHKRVFSLLMRKGCNLEMVDSEGNAISHLACIGGNIRMVKHLIKIGLMNEKLMNSKGQTPLQIARSHKGNNRDTIVALFQSRG